MGSLGADKEVSSRFSTIGESDGDGFLSTFNRLELLSKLYGVISVWTIDLGEIITNLDVNIG